jgi:hypothetical protein
MTETIVDLDLACTRVLVEGYGPGAWHGPDLKSAIADVSDDLAVWRASKDRRNIAEIVLHHAYYVHGLIRKITGRDSEPLVVAGDDWFDVPGDAQLSWVAVQEVVDREQKRLMAAQADIASGRITSPLSQSERFALVLGITCHAVYHAGQVQLIKKLHECAS